MRVSDLTPGEKLFLSRKRDGLSMADAAASHGVGLPTYRKWEKDEAEPEAKAPALGKLTMTDQFIVLRRRSGMTMKAIADDVGCCPWWLRQMELGDAPNQKLQEYWGIA